jgi:hypothetical protein
MTKKSVWPWAVALAYGGFAATMIGLVIFSLHNPTDLVSKDYYAQELKHQQRIDSERRARDDAHPPLMRYDRNRNAFVVEFASHAPDTGKLTFYRPSDAKLDRTVPLGLDAAGKQVIAVTDLEPGLWRMRLEWTRNSEDYYMEEVAVLN